MLYGYAGTIVTVDLTTGRIETSDSSRYVDRFLGGRGLATKIYWDSLVSDFKWDDADNPLIFVNGPLAGFKGLAGSRWQLCGKSPIGNCFSYANFGGSWGTQLKFAGYDALIVKGKADVLSHLHIDNNCVEIKTASSLTGKGIFETRQLLQADLGKMVRVLAIGPAGENRVKYATLMADNDSCGAGGLGAVMGAKNLKAITVNGNNHPIAADPDRLHDFQKELRQIKKSNLVMEIPIAPPEKMKKRICYGCISGCWRADYIAADGQKGKYMCQSAFFYMPHAKKYYQKKDTDVPFKANKLCDDYGVDSRIIDTMITWLKACYEQGILDDKSAGLPLSEIGSSEFAEELVKKVSLRIGIGDLLAENTQTAAENLGKEAEALITDYMTPDGVLDAYGPRIYPLNGLFYATEPRMPIQHLHEVSTPMISWAFHANKVLETGMTFEVLKTIAKRFWGGEAAADFSNDMGKALAAVTIQNRQYVYESLIFCNFTWPITYIPGEIDPVGDPSLESRICSTVTGQDLEKDQLYQIGERIFNLQRAILIREGWQGRSDDVLADYNYTIPIQGDVGNKACIVPGPDGEIVSHKGRTVDKGSFERLKDDYYSLRGWDPTTGLQTGRKLRSLELDDVADYFKLPDV